jgi:hypothetical protein
MPNTYETIGAYPVIEEVDLLNLASAANKPGDNRVGGDSAGKYIGKEILVRLTSDDSTKRMYALGNLSSDAWRVIDGSANITPVNILNAGGGAAWTVSAGCTYTAGLLTADGVDDPTASQVVVLKAGTYRLYGTAAYEGTTSDYDAPKLTITGATDGEVVAKVFTGARHATAAESADPKEVIDLTFTLTAASQNVTFEVYNVNEAGSLEAGSSFISLTKLEAM